MIFDANRFRIKQDIKKPGIAGSSCISHVCDVLQTGGVTIPPISLHGMQGLSKLESLTIESCQNIGSLHPLAELRSLKTLWLYNCGQLDPLCHLKNLTELREVTLNGNTFIQDGDLSILNELPKLKTVCIVNHPHYKPKADMVNRSTK